MTWEKLYETNFSVVSTETMCPPESKIFTM